MSYDREYNRLYKLRNKDKIKEYNRLYGLRNKAKIKEQHRFWFQRNRAWLREQHKEYQRRHVLDVKGKKRFGLSKRQWRPNCEVCGRERGKGAYHHWDDNNPSMGIWLCAWCHIMAERVDKGYHDIYLGKKRLINHNRILQGQLELPGLEISDSRTLDQEWQDMVAATSRKRRLHARPGIGLAQ